MDLNAFKPHFLRLIGMFGKAEGRVPVTTWFDMLSHIPADIWPEVVNRLIGSEKYMPTPDRVKEVFNDLQASRPEQVEASQRRTWCPDCNGTGLLTVEYEANGGRLYESVCRCAACQNWRGRYSEKFIARYRANLEANPEVSVLTAREKREDQEYVTAGDVDGLVEVVIS